jgi:hypothetical protein
MYRFNTENNFSIDVKIEGFLNKQNDGKKNICQGKDIELDGGLR